MRLLEGLSEILRFSIFSSLFLFIKKNIYFLHCFFFLSISYLIIFSTIKFIPCSSPYTLKNKTLVHLPLSVGNHLRVVLHQIYFTFIPPCGLLVQKPVQQFHLMLFNSFGIQFINQIGYITMRGVESSFEGMLSLFILK